MKLYGSLRYAVAYRSCSSYLEELCSKLAPFTSLPERKFFPLLAFSTNYILGVELGIQRHYKSAPLQERKMMDRRRILVKGGDGGDGCTSFRRSRHARTSVADGGRGGKGGDVILKCSEEVWDFSHLQYHISANRGGIGSSKKRVGSRGQDKIVHVPVGTVIHLVRGSISPLAESPLEVEDMIDDDYSISYMKEDEKSHEQTGNATNIVEEAEICSRKSIVLEHNDEVSDSSGTEMEDNEDNGDSDGQQDCAHDNVLQATQSSLAELLKPGQSLTVAHGGEGGRGNASMARGRGCEKRLPSREHESGHLGTEAILVLELKTIADVGFVGAPNAGKSTLLGAISRAKPQVGHYAFTTLRPNLGKLEFEDFFSITVADIPGLIKGAHQNVGLGHDFLRHIERTKALAYVVDLAASLDGRNGPPPWQQFDDLKFELDMYQAGLSSRPSLVVGTKLDEEGAEDMLREFRRRLPLTKIHPVCALLEQGIHELRVALRDLVCAQ